MLDYSRNYEKVEIKDKIEFSISHSLHLSKHSMRESRK